MCCRWFFFFFLPFILCALCLHIEIELIAPASAKFSLHTVARSLDSAPRETNSSLGEKHFVRRSGCLENLNACYLYGRKKRAAANQWVGQLGIKFAIWLLFIAPKIRNKYIIKLTVYNQVGWIKKWFAMAYSEWALCCWVWEALVSSLTNC